MKTLLLAAIALTLAAPALAEDAAVTTTVTTTAPAVAVTADAGAAVTYEQAFTSCTETTEAVASDKQVAIESCMSEKGFTVKDETTTTTGTASTTSEVTTETAQ